MCLPFLEYIQLIEGLPLYRQEKHFERMGIFLSRQTMRNWLLYGADRWLVALYERMHEHLLLEPSLMQTKQPSKSYANLGGNNQVLSVVIPYRTRGHPYRSL